MATPIAVLLVEDSARDADLLLLALEQGGYDPTCARVETAEEMNRALDEGAWDVIIADYSMPRFSGLVALEIVRRRGLDLPFLLVSGTVGEEVAVAAMKAGAHDYLMKGNLTRLAAAVERELREAADRRRGRQAEIALRQSEARYRQMFEGNQAIKLLIDPASGEIVDANQAACTFYGCTFREPAGKTIMDLSASPDDVVQEWIDRVLDDERSPFIFRHRLASGEEREVEVYSSVLDTDGRPLLFAIIHDVTERKRAEEALKYQAGHDALTGLANRTLLQEHLDQAILRAREQGAPVSLLLIDLDRFKEINDTFGHPAGDLLLRELGPRFGHLLGEMDPATGPSEGADGGAEIARLGGDEFAVLLPKTNRAGATSVADEILRGLQQPFVIEGQALDIGASIGIALYPAHGDSAELLLQHADVAMYEAKRSRMAQAVYEPATDPYTRSRIALIADLRRAIADDELLVHYQPKMDIRTGGVLGAEALIRWHSPERGFVPPRDIVDLAEHTGLIKPLSLRVLVTAIRQCRAWWDAGWTIQVAVNLSARSLHDHELVHIVHDILKAERLPPAALTIEITETAMMIDPPRAATIIRRFAAMGVKVSIDDFGTGYSSLSYLRELRANEVKIDKSFVLEMDRTAGDQRIVRATIALAHDLGLTAVAEGIETEATWNRLKSLKCDAGQGYYFARPMDANTFSQWLNQPAPGAPTAIA